MAYFVGRNLCLDSFYLQSSPIYIRYAQKEALLMYLECWGSGGLNNHGVRSVGAVCFSIGALQPGVTLPATRPWGVGVVAAQSRSCFHVFGPRVGIVSTLGALGLYLPEQTRTHNFVGFL